MRILTISIVLISLLFSACRKKEDIRCDNAELLLCNPTNDQIVPYGWGTNYVTDTLFPGECMTRDFGRTIVSYDMWGNEDLSQTAAATLYTPGGSMTIEMKVCKSRMNAPYGYQDISFCYNGQFDPDQGEYGVDCGGKCLPCKTLIAPCDSALTKDRMKWHGQNNLLLASSFYLEFDSKMDLDFTFSNGEELTLKLPFKEFPNSNRQFLTGDGFFHADITYYNQIQYRFPLDSQLIYYEIDSSGAKRIEFCQLEFTDSFNSSFASASLTID